MCNTGVSAGKLCVAVLCRRGKNCLGPDCVLKVWFHPLAQLLYSLVFHLVAFILPATSRMGTTSLTIAKAN